MANAWYLPFDGVDDKLTFTQVNRTDPTWELEVIFADDTGRTSGTNRVLASSTEGGTFLDATDPTSSQQSTLNVTYRVAATSVVAVIAAGQPLHIGDGVIVKLNIVFDGSDYSFSINDNTPTIVTAANLGFRFFDEIRLSNTIDPVAARFYSLTYWSDNTRTTKVLDYKNNVDDTQSDFPELVSAANATPVGFAATLPWSLYDDGTSVANTAPTANAGADFTPTAGSTAISLDGTGSTAGSSAITGYEWTFVSGPTNSFLYNANTDSPFFTRLLNVTGTYVYSLTVTDANGLTSTDTVNVNLVADVDAPNPVAGADFSADGGSTFTLDGSASTYTGGVINGYAWEQTSGPNCTIANANQAIATVTVPDVVANEVCTFSLTLNTDNLNGMKVYALADTVDVTIAAVNPIPIANAGSNITVIEGTEFTLDGSASIDAGGTIVSYAWTQIQGIDTPLANASAAITTGTAPVLNDGDQVLRYQLIVTDNENGVSDPSVVEVLVQDVSAAPNANAGANAAVSTGQNYTLSAAASTSDSAIASYRWRQLSGIYTPLSDRDSISPSIAIPLLSNRKAFAQDLYGPSPISTTTTLAVPTGLSKLIDFTYAGAFRIEHIDGQFDSNFIDGNIGLSADGTSLFVAGRRSSIGEFTIPATLSLESDPLLVPSAAIKQSWFNPFLLNTAVTEFVSDRADGFLEYNGSLLVSSEIWYDGGANHIDNLQVFTDVENLEAGGNKGFLQLEGAARAAGWMSIVPVEHQSLLGGAYVTGWGTNSSITGRHSQGPSLFVFDPQDAINQTLEGDRSVPTTPLLDYNGFENAIVPNRQLYLVNTDPMYGAVTTAKYGFFIPNTNFIMYIGAHGGNEGGVGYKITQDTGDVCGGQCTYIKDDNYNYYWIYDLDDIANATNPWDAKPIQYGKWSHPFDDGTKVLRGGAFDYANNRLYICIDRAGIINRFSNAPMIVAYDFTGKAQEVTAIGTDASDLVFEVTVTDVNGLSSTDRVTLSVDTNFIPDTTPPVITFSPPQTVYNLTVGDNFTPPTATAIDSIDGVVAVTSTGTVNTATAGAYFLTYTATDSSGNTATRTVTVNVTPEVIIDATAPVITVSGQPITTVSFQGTAPVFTVTATDNIDGTLTAVQTGDTVNTSVAGTYVLRWNVTDSSGNAAQEVVRTVVVLEENVTPTTSMATVIVDGTPNGTYDVNFTNPTTGDLIDIQSLVFVGGRATTQIDVVAGTSFRAHVFTPTHLFGNTGVTV